MSYAAVELGARTHSPHEIRATLDELAQLPAFLRACVQRATPERLLRRPGAAPDAFSIHEQVWHLRDIDVLGYARRVRAVASEERAFLADLDGTRLAVERRYLDLPLDTALDELERSRADTLAFLRTLPHAAFARRGEMEGVGCLSLAELLEMWRNHDRGHRDELDALLG